MKKFIMFTLFVLFWCSTATATLKNVLIYYGYPSSFDYPTNSWNMNNVCWDMGYHYDIVVLGDGVQDPSHGDYSNTQTLITCLKTYYSTTKIFGYVTTAQTLANFEDKVDDWETLQVDGIFMDESGYEFGKTRSEFNDRVDYVHGQTYAKLVIANAWFVDHVLGTDNDPSYPNSTYNSGEDESNLTSSDYYLLENFTISQSNYESQAQWFARGNKAKLKQSTYSIKLLAVSELSNSDGNAQEKFNNIYYGATLWGLEGVGSSDTNYGASTSIVTFWTRPSVSHLD